jgi:hypothetical protein
MTATDPFLEQLETYLDEFEGFTPLPETIRDEVRAALPTTKQLRPEGGLPRFNAMNGYTRYAVAAAVLALAAIIGFGVFRSQVGPAPQPTPSPSANGGGPLTDELAHLFVGGGANAPEPYAPGTVAAIHMETGTFYYELDGNRGTILQSNAEVLPGNRVRLTSTSITGGCEPGDVGTYQYSLTPGGNFLTFTVEADDCAGRAQAIGGEWERTACKADGGYCLGPLEAGTYQSAIVDPRSSTQPFASRFGAITYTVPDGWANFLDDGLNYGLTTTREWNLWDGRDCFDCPGTRDLVEVLVGPGAARTDCTEENEPGIGFGRQDLVDWMQSHPGLDVTNVQNLTVNGLDATSLVVTARADWTGTCPEDEDTSFAAVPLFYHQDSWHWALNLETSYGVVLLDLGDGNTVAVMIDSADESQLESFMADAMPIIESLEFPDPS